MLKKPLAFICLTLFSLSVNSAIINSNNSASGYDLQGLEWLSLDVTTGLFRADILDGFIGNDNVQYTYSEQADINNGSWRYATEDELYRLIDPNGFMAENTNLFPLQIFYSMFDWFSTEFGYFENPDYGTGGVSNWGEKVSKFWFGSAGQGGHITLTSGTICWGCSLGNSYYTSESGDVGSYSYSSTFSYGAPLSSLLVRTSEVPIPATGWLLLTALVALAGKKRSSF